MRRSLAIAVLLVLATSPSARATDTASRVIVSVTLDDALYVFDANTLAQTQSPVLSKGAGPVRMAVHSFGGHPYLFTANHGVEGSVGVFDLAGGSVAELPASPFPAGPGSVGIAAGSMGSVPMVFVTNTVQAVGGCGMPAGSVSAFNASLLSSAGILYDGGSASVGGALPYGVAANGPEGRVFATVNCTSKLYEFGVARSDLGGDLGVPSQMELRGSTATHGGPDGVLVDDLGHVWVANIAASDVEMGRKTIPGDATTWNMTTVPLPDGHPIDIALAGSPGGRHWIVTSNGGDDSVSLVDRDVALACSDAGQASCPQAQVLHVKTGVPGGAPEGVAYDPVSNRIFAVNKTLGAPSLTVIQVTESPLSGTVIATIPLKVPVAGFNAFIAFDVVVQIRN